MSGDIGTLQKRYREAVQGAYSADVASLMALIERLAQNPEASVIDQALLGRIRASAKLLGRSKWVKERARSSFYREWRQPVRRESGEADE